MCSSHVNINNFKSCMSTYKLQVFNSHVNINKLHANIIKKQLPCWKSNMLWTFDQFLKIMLIQTYNIYIVIYVSGWSDCCYNTFHVKLIWPFCSTYYLACRNIWWKNNLHGGGIQAIRISHALYNVRCMGNLLSTFIRL